jgi:outer membrane putative beta-barrel porin/alpha-amylase
MIEGRAPAICCVPSMLRADSRIVARNCSAGPYSLALLLEGASSWPYRAAGTLDARRRSTLGWSTIARRARRGEGDLLTMILGTWFWQLDVATPRKGAAPFSHVRALVCVSLLALVPAPAWAQQTLNDTLIFLMTNQSTPDVESPLDHQVAVATANTIAGSLLTGLSTLPIGSSGTGFTYRVDRDLGGIVQRASDSFGPFFTERSLTVGRGRGSLGVSFQHSSFDALDGRSLTDGTLITAASKVAATSTTPEEIFDVETLTLRIRTNSMTLSGNYGVSDRVDVGAALPLIRVSLDGERVNDNRGNVTLQATATGTASGIGDVALRVKYNVYRAPGNGVAVGAEARLPTGDEENLLGAGEASLKPRVVWSIERGRIAVDTDFGYSFGGLSDELSYAAALTVIGTPRLMLIGEVTGGRFSEIGRLTEITTPRMVPGVTGVSTTRLTANEEARSRFMAVMGAKWNPGATWLISGNVLRRLSTAGLTAQWVPTVSVEYSFGR